MPPKYSLLVILWTLLASTSAGLGQLRHLRKIQEDSRHLSNVHASDLQKPTVNPAGQFLPSCTCPIPMPGLGDERWTRGYRYGRRQPPLFDTVEELPDGDVEVVTVNVPLANQVRSQNVTLAEDIARVLHIPVKRVSVLPWSWTQGPPQPHYLAFVQEDHERCDCQGQDGKTMEGLGFKRTLVSTSASVDDSGVPLNANTTAMTVAQHKAVQSWLKAEKQVAVAPEPVLATNSTDRARVQMLTRDPCLAELLIEHTQLFRDKIAELLDLPEDKIIINPPPVKGTIGLLQLESVTHRSKDVPILGVRHCDAEVPSLLSSLQRRNVPPMYPVLANSTNATPPIFTVAPVNMSNGTNGTSLPFTDDAVSLTVRLGGLDYDHLAASMAQVSSFTLAIKTIIAEAGSNFSGTNITQSGNIAPQDVEIALYPGSVVVDALIRPSGIAPAAIIAALGANLCNEMHAQVDGIASEWKSLGLESVQTGENITCTILKLELDVKDQGHESNRAWIAFWSIIVLPPYSVPATQRLLEEVDTPLSDLAKILPLTVARVPGLDYRSMQEEPNAAQETRLPPPLEKAVGFALPDPEDEEEALKDEESRLRREIKKSGDAIQAKKMLETSLANDAFNSGEKVSSMINQVKTQAKSAALEHARILRSGKEGPSIVPYQDIAVHAELEEDPDSPYPWFDQMDSHNDPVALLARGSGRRTRQSKVLGSSIE